MTGVQEEITVAQWHAGNAGQKKEGKEMKEKNQLRSSTGHSAACQETIKQMPAGAAILEN